MANLMETGVSREIRKQIDLRGCRFDKSGLEILCKKLAAHMDKIYELEIQRVPDLNQEGQDKLRELLTLEIHVGSRNPEKGLIGTVGQVFGKDDFPENIDYFVVGSDYKFRKEGVNHLPANNFFLKLDFSTPYKFDFSLNPSSKTPNESTFSISGNDDNWVLAFYADLNELIENKKNSKIKFLHSSGVYDALLFGLGLPLSFYFCYLMSGPLESIMAGQSTFVINAAYFYIFFVMLNAFKYSFHSVRSAFPIVAYGKSEIFKYLSIASVVLSLPAGIGWILERLFGSN